RGDGTSKSAASRRFVGLSADRLAEWMASDLSELGRSRNIEISSRRRAFGIGSIKNDRRGSPQPSFAKNLIASPKALVDYLPAWVSKILMRQPMVGGATSRSDVLGHSLRTRNMLESVSGTAS